MLRRPGTSSAGCDPPGAILRRLGGPEALRRLERHAAPRAHLVAVSKTFERRYEQGLNEGQWSSQSAMAKAIEATPTYVSRLLSGDPDQMGNMSFADLTYYAAVLNVSLPASAPGESVEAGVALEVLRAMEQRRTQDGMAVPRTAGSADADAVNRLAWSIGFIDDDSVNADTSWDSWVKAQSARLAARGRSADAQAQAVRVGDWLAARIHLPLFESQLVASMERLHTFAVSQARADLLGTVRDLIGRVAEVQSLRLAFRNRQGVRDIEDVKRALKLRTVAAVQHRLDRVGLEAADFQGDDAVLGRLIVRSPVVRPLYEEFIRWREQIVQNPRSQQGRDRP